MKVYYEQLPEIRDTYRFVGWTPGKANWLEIDKDDIQDAGDEFNDYYSKAASMPGVDVLTRGYVRRNDGVLVPEFIREDNGMYSRVPFELFFAHNPDGATVRFTNLVELMNEINHGFKKTIDSFERYHAAFFTRARREPNFDELDRLKEHGYV